MVNWVLIIVLAVIGFIAIKLSHLRHKVWAIIFIVLALFLYLSIIFVTSQNNLDLNSAEGIIKAGKIYVSWLANGFSNLKTLTGYAINMDWRPKINESDTEKNKDEK